VNESKHSRRALKNQVEAVKDQIKKLTRKLKQPLEESAREHKALERRRVVKSAQELLLALFMYTLSKMSLRMLAASTGIIGLADMSDQAWQKKL